MLIDYKEHLNEIWSALELLQSMRYGSDFDDEEDNYKWDDICYSMAQLADLVKEKESESMLQHEQHISELWRGE